MNKKSIITDMATLELGSDGIMTVHLKEKKCLTVDGLAQVLTARRELASDGPACILGVVPDQMDFDPKVVYTDHHEGVDTARFTRAMGLVIKDELVKKLTNIYLKHRNPDFPVRIFKDEAEARIWLVGFLESDKAG